MNRKKRWRKFNIDGVEVGIAATIHDSQPSLQVTVIFGPGESVASISRYWRMNSVNAAQNVVDKATESDITRAMDSMKPDIDVASQFQGLLVKYSKY